jgi:hypothetical protein
MHIHYNIQSTLRDLNNLIKDLETLICGDSITDVRVSALLNLPPGDYSTDPLKAISLKRPYHTLRTQDWYKDISGGWFAWVHGPDNSKDEFKRLQGECLSTKELSRDLALTILIAILKAERNNLKRSLDVAFSSNNRFK